jgi:phosphatidylinositol-3-phosphatase
LRRLLIAAVMLLGVVGTQLSQAEGCQSRSVAHPVTKIMLIVEENRSEAEAVSPGAMPYLMGLASRPGGAYLTNYRAVTHPSSPNYIALTSGLVREASGCRPAACPVTRSSVFGRTIAAGGRAASYQESMPSNCHTADRGRYVVGHNPWAYFVNDRSRCSQFDIPIGNAIPHPRHLPRLSEVTPNGLHNAHDGSITAADTWLHHVLPAVLHSDAYRTGALAIVVTFDEADGSCACNNVLMVVLEARLRGRGFATSVPLTHIDTYRSMLAVGTGNGGGPLLAAFGL